jgi:hypothetical protein
MQPLEHHYRIEVTQFEGRDHYWELYCNDEKVNGGIGDWYSGALNDARREIRRHCYVSGWSPGSVTVEEV